jgi:hypothetical protein
MRLRRFIVPILGILIGYTLGYQDAFRGPSSLGWKIGELIDRVTPNSVLEARKRNAEALRQRQQEGLTQPE